MSGLTINGFDSKRLEDLKLDFESLLENKLGEINKDPDAMLGQLIGVYSKSATDLYELLESIYNSQYAATAEGVSLDNACDRVGVNRLSATKSIVLIQAKGLQGTVIPQDYIVSVLKTGVRFKSLNSTTIDKDNAVSLDVSIVTIQDSTDYTITVNSEAITYTSDASATPQEIITGLQSQVTSSSQPITAIDNGDETLTINADDLSVSFVSSVTANLSIDSIKTNVSMESEEYGPIQAISNTLNNIVTTVSNWESANNYLDASVGRNEETDAALRLRRNRSLQIAGAGTVEAIKAKLLQITGVEGAEVIENETGIVDSDGRPAHCFEAIISGGDDQELADEIWLAKPAGIQSHGTTTVVVVDSQGENHDIKFSRATPVYVWIRITLTKSTEIAYPTDGDQQIKISIVEINQDVTIDNDIIAQSFLVSVYSVPGITNAIVEIATSVTAGGPPGSYVTTNIAIAATDLAVYDTTRITIL